MNPLLLFFVYYVGIKYYFNLCFFIVKSIRSLIKILNGTKEYTPFKFESSIPLTCD
jgi:hypothetical protein